MTEVYFLGAGKPFKGEQHSALHDIDNSSKVLDWSLEAINFFNPKCFFVCGYQAEALKASHPKLKYIENKEWESTKAGWSLLTALSKESKDMLVSYSDIVFRESAVKNILKSDSDIVVAVDSQWRSRYSGRNFEELNKCEKVCLSKNTINLLGSNIDTNQANAEFIGLVYFSKKATKELLKIKKEHQNRNAFCLCNFIL